MGPLLPKVKITFPELCPPGGLQTVPGRNKSSRLLPQGDTPVVFPFPEELPGLQWEPSGSHLRLTGRRNLAARRFHI